MILRRGVVVSGVGRVWSVIEPVLPVRPANRRGAKPLPDRQTLQGILFVLFTGIGWEDLPQELGDDATGPSRWTGPRPGGHGDRRPPQRRHPTTAIGRRDPTDPRTPWAAPTTVPDAGRRPRL